MKILKELINSIAFIVDLQSAEVAYHREASGSLHHDFF